MIYDEYQYTMVKLFMNRLLSVLWSVIGRHVGLLLPLAAMRLHFTKRGRDTSHLVLMVAKLYSSSVKMNEREEVREEDTPAIAIRLTVL